MNRRNFLKRSAASLGSTSLLSRSARSKTVASEPRLFDIAPFARRCSGADKYNSQLTFEYEFAATAGAGAVRASDGRYIYALQWAEERDIKEIRVRFRAARPPDEVAIEYWSEMWPFPPPQMPSIEDPAEDPWQGRWLRADSISKCAGDQWRYTFQPLRDSENPRANYLPGVDYRRTLKIRLVCKSEPMIERVRVFSGSFQKSESVRIELGAGESSRQVWDGTVKVYNGLLKKVKLWKGSEGDTADTGHFQVTTEGSPKGLLLDLVAAQPSLPGSEDVTIVTVESGERTFSFAVPDLEKGPIYVPAFHAYVSRASDARPFSPAIVQKGMKIRDRILKEPEQTYERATAEIPPLDPSNREGQHDRLYLPLAPDASWQKFTIEWGGNIYISKKAAKVKGDELKRLEWDSDEIYWRIGTGEHPSFRPGWKDSVLRMLDDDQPVTIATWRNDGIHYMEEAFATLLSGPLAPDDPGRSEQTPAVLMLKLSARNANSQAASAHIWLATQPREEASYSNGMLTVEHGQLIRAHLKMPDSFHATSAMVPFEDKSLSGVRIEAPLGPGEEQALFLLIPFVPRLSPDERHQLTALDYERERAKVLGYWQQIVARGATFEVPEERFTRFVRAFAPRLLLSNVRDPKTNLYMVPAATYTYNVFANVSSLQCITLNFLGYPKLGASGLETFVRLQGSVPIAGTYTGDQLWVYHGTRINQDYDYTTGPYGLDQGAVLWALTEQYFLTRDESWLRDLLPSMMHAADWIVEQRKLTQVLDGGERVPEYGLLPAGRLEDNTDWGHWFGINAECVIGMNSLAKALSDIGAPEAAYYVAEAKAYQQDVRNAALGAARASAVVRLRDNTYIPYVPTKPHQRIRLFGPLRVGYYSRYPEKVLPCYRAGSTREMFAGPILLLLREVFQNDEPIADWILDDWEDNISMSSTIGVNVHGWVDDKYWFSRGGMNFEALRQTVPVYLRRNEIPAAIRSLYNCFVATYYPEPNVFTEEYHQWVHASGPFYKTADEARFVNRIRYMLIREDGDTLWLASGTPRRWLDPGKKIEVKDAPTHFGPMRFQIEASESKVEAKLQLPTRNPIGKVWFVLRAPSGKQIREVEINGKPWLEFESVRERISLPVTTQAMRISVRLTSSRTATNQPDC